MRMTPPSRRAACRATPDRTREAGSLSTRPFAPSGSAPRPGRASAAIRGRTSLDGASSPGHSFAAVSVTEPAHDPAGAVVQRLARVKDSSHLYEAVANQAPDPLAVANPGARATEILEDPFDREYLSKQEFEDHAAGQPVDVGLLPHIAKWYRLPFSGPFFVLGENHGVANYRTLIEESNQTGKVLGEGGTVPIDHYAKAADQREEVLTKKVGQADEIAMESVLAKTQFALQALVRDYQKQVKAQHKRPAPSSTPVVPTTTASTDQTLAPEDWLAEASKSGVDVERNKRQVPYYEEQGTKKFLGSTEDAKESGYSTGKTASGVIKKCLTAIGEYEKSASLTNTPLAPLKAALPGAIRNVDDWDKLSIGPQGEFAFKTLPRVVTLCADAAMWELKKSAVQHGGKTGQALFDEQRKQTSTYEKLLGEACTMRDIYMLEAIVDANAKGFLMAGVGDNHLQHLKPALDDASLKIPNITFDEFMTKHTQDAF